MCADTDNFIRKTKSLELLTEAKEVDLPDYTLRERRLWASCLSRTLLDIDLYLKDEDELHEIWNVLKRELALDGIYWIMARSTDPGGFVWVCEFVYDDLSEEVIEQITKDYGDTLIDKFNLSHNY